MAILPATIAEGLKLGATPTDASGYRLSKRGLAPTLSSRLKIGGTLSARFRPGALIAERLKLRLVSTPTTTFHLTVRDRTLRIKGVLAVGLAVRLMGGTVSLRGKVTATPLVLLRERLKLSQRAQVNVTFALLLRDASKVGIGAVIREAMHLSSRLDRAYLAIAAVTDKLVMADELAFQLRIIVTAQEGVRLTERDMLRMIYHGTLSDCLAVTVGFYDPASDTTTWAINARTGAVTEYTGYAFNSFAAFSSGYLGASEDGLYELNADTDAGQPIIADMISGLLEMTGSNLTTIKGVYLAMRGPGELFLKLVADERRTTTYRVLASSLRTARVNVGKGWRARYFSYQLVTTGQDFDLEGIEFLPVASVRRV